MDWWGQHCALPVISEMDTEEAALRQQICNLSITKKAEEGVGYISCEK